MITKTQQELEAVRARKRAIVGRSALLLGTTDPAEIRAVLCGPAHTANYENRIKAAKILLASLQARLAYDGRDCAVRIWQENVMDMAVSERQRQEDARRRFLDHLRRQHESATAEVASAEERLAGAILRRETDLLSAYRADMDSAREHLRAVRKNYLAAMNGRLPIPAKWEDA